MLPKKQQIKLEWPYDNMKYVPSLVMLETMLETCNRVDQIQMATFMVVHLGVHLMETRQLSIQITNLKLSLIRTGSGSKLFGLARVHCTSLSLDSRNTILHNCPSESSCPGWSD